MCSPKTRGVPPKYGWTSTKVQFKKYLTNSFSEFYFAAVPSAKMVKFGDISKRTEVRER